MRIADECDVRVGRSALPGGASSIDPRGAGDADLAANLARLARRYPELSPEEQTVVRHLVGTWVNDD